MRNTVNCCVWIFIFAYAVDGFDQSCVVNETLFVPIGSQAVFRAMFTRSYHSFYFDKWNSTRRTVFHARFQCCFTTEMNIYFYDLWMENRTEMSFQGEVFEEGNVTVIINDVQKEDNGTYRLINRERHCWVLFVMNIYRQPSGPIEEQLHSYFYAQPFASLIRRPVINATMIWLVNGLNITQSPQFVLQDGMIWIASISRKLHGRNITYRAVEDNGKITEVNYTVEVTYGPTSPLLFKPETEQYFISSGHSVPNIICSVDCNPPCNLSWVKHGKDNILSLEKVSPSMAGEYICTATRAGTDVVLKKSLTIHVSDDTRFTLAIAIVASIQAVTTTVMGVFLVCICMRNKTVVCNKCSDATKARHADDKTKKSGHERNATIEMEHYEELDVGAVHPSGSRFQHVKSTGETSNRTLEVYENTKIA